MRKWSGQGGATQGSGNGSRLWSAHPLQEALSTSSPVVHQPAQFSGKPHHFRLDHLPGNVFQMLRPPTSTQHAFEHRTRRGSFVAGGQRTRRSRKGVSMASQPLAPWAYPSNSHGHVPGWSLSDTPGVSQPTSPSVLSARDPTPPHPHPFESSSLLQTCPRSLTGTAMSSVRCPVPGRQRACSVWSPNKQKGAYPCQCSTVDQGPTLGPSLPPDPEPELQVDQACDSGANTPGRVHGVTSVAAELPFPWLRDHPPQDPSTLLPGSSRPHLAVPANVPLLDQLPND